VLRESDQRRRLSVRAFGDRAHRHCHDLVRMVDDEACRDLQLRAERCEALKEEVSCGHGSDG